MRTILIILRDIYVNRPILHIDNCIAATRSLMEKGTEPGGLQKR
jgi:hypothetical protein